MTQPSYAHNYTYRYLELPSTPKATLFHYLCQLTTRSISFTQCAGFFALVPLTLTSSDDTKVIPDGMWPESPAYPFASKKMTLREAFMEQLTPFLTEQVAVAKSQNKTPVLIIALSKEVIDKGVQRINDLIKVLDQPMIYAFIHMSPDEFHYEDVEDFGVMYLDEHPAAFSWYTVIEPGRKATFKSFTIDSRLMSLPSQESALEAGMRLTKKGKWKSPIDCITVIYMSNSRHFIDEAVASFSYDTTDSE